MAYLRKEKETIEIEQPIGKVWSSIQEALQKTEWTIEEVDSEVHHAKAKTKPTFMSYGSVILIDVFFVDRKTTRVSISAETPVTTITSVFDFGRTQDRIDLFLQQLSKQLKT